MGLPSTKFRSELDPVTRKELDAENAELSEFLSVEHHDDGTHASTTHDHITVRSADEFVELVAITPGGDVNVGTFTQENNGTNPALVLDLEDGAQFAIDKEAGTGGDDRQIAIGVQGSALSPNEQQIGNSAVVMKRLLLLGQSSYTPSANDATALIDVTFGPAYSYYRLTPSAARTIDGIYCLDVTNGARGQLVELVNDSAFIVTFRSTIVSSARRLYLPNNLPIAIGPKGTARFIYDTANLGWRLHGYTGQDWIDIAFDAANFSSTSGWTVGSGDQLQYVYQCVGKTMTVAFYLNATSVVGGDQSLKIAIPGGMVAARLHQSRIYISDNGTIGEGFAQVASTDTTIGCFRADVANWAAATNTTVVFGQITFSIQ